MKIRRFPITVRLTKVRYLTGNGSLHRTDGERGKPLCQNIGRQLTVVTVDGKNCAHYEHTIAITEEGCEILTKAEKLVSFSEENRPRDAAEQPECLKCRMRFASAIMMVEKLDKPVGIRRTNAMAKVCREKRQKAPLNGVLHVVKTGRAANGNLLPWTRRRN